MEATTLADPAESHKSAKAALAWYMGGMLVFLAVADWSVSYWVSWYWLWQTSKDVFFIAALYLHLKEYRAFIFPILFFSIIRASWEIVAQIWGQDINATKIVDLLFYLLLTILILRLVKSLRKQWDQSWPL